MIPASQIGYLTVRKEPQGGQLLDSVKELDPKIPVLKADIIILVHGYNVNLEEGKSAYTGFLDKLGSYFPNGCPYNIYHFYWSGDVKNKILSALSYPWEIPYAKRAAELLFTYLNSLAPIGGRPLRIHFVSHSLGNRLILEEIKNQLQVNFPHRIIFYAGMASAVPVYMVDSGGILNNAAISPDRTLILYSIDDIILHSAFPIGQTTAREGFMPQAVGRLGSPERNVWTIRYQMSGYNHGDYWNGDTSIAKVGQALNLPVPNSLSETVTPTYSLPESNSINPNIINSRSLLRRTIFGMN